MHMLRSISVGLGAMALVAVATAQFDRPAPLAWRWTPQTTGNIGGSPVVKGDTIYQAVGGRVYCIERQTGNRKWQYPQLDPLAGNIRSTPILTGDTLIATADNKYVYAIDANTGSAKWSVGLPMGTYGSPTLVGKFLVVPMSDNTLTAIDVEKGELAWKTPYKIDDGINGSINAFGDYVILMTGRNEVFAVNVITEKLQWRRQLTQLAPKPSTTISSDTIYVNSGPYIVGLNATNGLARWQIPTQQQLVLAPVLGKTTMMVVTNDGKGLVYDLTTRKAVTPAPLDFGSQPLVLPTAVDDRYIVETANGAINLIDPKQVSKTDPKVVDPLWAYIVRPMQNTSTSSNSGNDRGGPGRGGPGGFGGFGGGLGGPQGGGSNNNNDDDNKVVSVPAVAPAVLAGDTLLVPVGDNSLLAFDKTNGVDLTPPKVEMLFPNAGDQISGAPPLLFYFRITDDASGVKNNSLAIEINGQPMDYKLNKDGTVFVQITQTGKNKPLSDGRKEVVVTVADWMGNVQKKTFAITIDNALPPIKLSGSDDNSQNGPGGPNGPRGGGGRGGNRGGGGGD